jgi:hypothetical protein
VYSVPTNVDASGQRDFFAPYGKRFTTVKGKTSDLWGFQVKSIRDCTMDDLVGDRNGYPSFCGYATNCIINTRTTGTINPAFLCSTVEDCVITCLYDYPANQNGNNRAMFHALTYEKNTVRNSTIYIVSTNNYPAALVSGGNGADFENCHIVASNISHFVCSASARLKNCTVLIPDNATWGNITAENCLMGCGEGDGVLTVGTNNVCAAYSEVAPRIGTDYRPAVTDWQYYFKGYKSAADRAFRDAVKDSILAELLPAP